MKCSNFHTYVNCIKIQECKELIQALMPYNGYFSFLDYCKSKSKCPIIAVCDDSSLDVIITSMQVDGTDVKFECIGFEDGCDYQFWSDDFYAGELQYVINEIPSKNGIKDVSDKTFEKRIKDIL